jgi:hypothetical protein
MNLTFPNIEVHTSSSKYLIWYFIWHFETVRWSYRLQVMVKDPPPMIVPVLSGIASLPTYHLTHPIEAAAPWASVNMCSRMFAAGSM